MDYNHPSILISFRHSIFLSEACLQIGDEQTGLSVETERVLPLACDCV